jgi:hypothetical protein
MLSLAVLVEIVVSVVDSVAVGSVSVDVLLVPGSVTALSGHSFALSQGLEPQGLHPEGRSMSGSAARGA